MEREGRMTIKSVVYVSSSERDGGVELEHVAHPCRGEHHDDRGSG